MNDFISAAERGDAVAQSALAVGYFSGQGFEKDLEKARHWAEKSAGQGNADGMYILGGIYTTWEDYENAEHWLQKSIDAGHSFVQTDLDGVRLLKRHKQNAYKRAVNETLCALANKLGEPIFHDRRRLKAALADIPIAKDAAKVRHLLNIAVGELDFFGQIKTSGAGIPLVAARLTEKMVTDYAIDKNTAKLVFECLGEFAERG